MPLNSGVGQTIQDGFQVLKTFSGHGRHVRGFDIVNMVEDGLGITKRKQQLLSWDVKGIYLWENDFISKVIKFPKSQQSFISCFVHITKLNVFFGPSLDMAFRIYDSSFNLIESIHHEERVILDCEYDKDRDILILSGAGGVSVWRMSRNYSTVGSFVLEKLFNFEGCTEWVTKMLYEPSNNRVYAISEQSLSVLDFRRRAVKVRLEDIHESPITCACWYAADQFYITSCSRGVVRCWAPRANAHEQSSNQAKHSMLHSFNAHSKAVTGLCVHPSPGMLITAALDGYIKVFDLESFTQLQSIHLDEGVAQFKLSRYQHSPVCLFSHPNGDMSMWRIESCCTEFGVCASDIVSLNMFESMLDVGFLRNRRIRYSEDDFFDEIGEDRSESGDKGKESRPATTTTTRVDTAGTDGSLLLGVPSSIPTTARTGSRGTALIREDTPVNDPAESSADEDEAATNEPMVDLENRCTVAFAGHDMQILALDGTVKSRVDPEALVDGVRTYTMSVFQQLLFCVLESGGIRIFCTKSPMCVLLREIYVGSIGSDLPLCLALTDGMSLSALRSALTSKDMRGNPSPLNVDEALLVGTSSGTLVCLDTFQECATVSIQQIFSGRVDCLKYRRSRNELVGMGWISGCSSRAIKVWRVPEMTFTHEIVFDNTFSSWEISPTMSFICVGSTDGFSRLFNLLDTSSERATAVDKESIDTATSYSKPSVSKEIPQGSFIEVLRQEGGHEAEIIAITFCDELRAYATSSKDCMVKFWDFEKRYIKSILFDSPPLDILFNYPVGELLVTQKSHILNVAMEVWEGKGLLQAVKDEEDPWDMGWIDEDPKPSRITTASKLFKQDSSDADTTTFLTENQDMPVLNIMSDEGGGRRSVSAEDYWKFYSSLGNLSTRKPKRPKAVLNVRYPNFDMPVRPALRRFAKRMKEKKEAEERARIEAEAADEGASELSKENSTALPEILPTQMSSNIADKHSSPKAREAFIKTVSRVQTMARMTVSRRPSVKFTKSFSKSESTTSNPRASRSTVTQKMSIAATPPLSKAPSRALSMIQRRALSTCSSLGDTPVEYTDEYFIKPNGPLLEDSNR